MPEQWISANSELSTTYSQAQSDCYNLCGAGAARSWCPAIRTLWFLKQSKTKSLYSSKQQFERRSSSSIKSWMGWYMEGKGPERRIWFRFGHACGRWSLHTETAPLCTSNMPEPRGQTPCNQVVPVCRNTLGTMVTDFECSACANAYGRSRIGNRDL